MTPSSLSITYRMAADAPPAMPWSEYERRLRAEWSELLSSEPGERAIQSFLELHPCLVPGAHAAIGRMTSGHGPFPSALIAQPALSGLGDRIPDFVWIAGDSLFFNPVFVEIEDPAKPYLTKAGHQHHQLTYALQQLSEWRDWFNEPVNRQLFLETYRVPDILRRRTWEPIYVLIYGRQEQDPERIRKLRTHLTKANTQFVIPYEHLQPDRDCSEYLCVRKGGNGYIAVSVPPTIRLGPSHAENRCLIGGRDKAINASTWLSRERREFLIERFPYWDEWARAGGNLRRSGDAE